MDMAEKVTVHADMEGVTSEAIIIINISNITAMNIVLSNMVHHVLYAADIIIPKTLF